MKNFFGFIVTVVIVTSCTKEVGRPMPIVQIDSCSTNISYAQQIVPLINQSCAISGCHVASGYRDFSNYTVLKNTIDAYPNFITRFKSGGDMPPSYSIGPPLTACQISKLESWIKAGALNN